MVLMTSYCFCHFDKSLYRSNPSDAFNSSKYSVLLLILSMQAPALNKSTALVLKPSVHGLLMVKCLSNTTCVQILVATNPK